MSETSKRLSPVSLMNASQGHQRTVDEGYLPANGPLTWWTSAAFAAIIGFSRISYGLLLPLLQANLKGSFSDYGLIGTTNLIGYLLGILMIPLVLTWYHNNIRLTTISLALLNLFMVVSAFSFDLLQLGIWRFLIGLFSAPATVLALALTLKHVRPQQRGLASAFIWMGGSIGVLISGLFAPLVISTGSALSWRIVWITMGGIGLVATYGYYRELLKRAAFFQENTSSPQSQGSQMKGWHDLLETMVEVLHPRKLLFLTVAYFGIGFGYIIYIYYFPTLVVRQGFSSLLVGLVWAGLGLTGIIASPIWGRLMDCWPSGWLLAANMFLGAVGTLGVLTGQPVVEFLGTLVFGLTLFGAGPAIVAFLLRRAVSDERYASSFSLLTILFAVGQALGPVVGGFAVDRLGLPQGTATAALIIGISTFFGLGYGVMQQRGLTAAQH